MNHIVIGAAVPLCFLSILCIIKQRMPTFRELLFLPFLILACIIWALLPDIPRIFGFLDLYYRLSKDPRTNIFLFHYYIDHFEQYNSFLYVILVILLMAMQIAVFLLLKREEDTIC